MLQLTSRKNSTIPWSDPILNMVLPHGTQAWDPFIVKDINIIEKVQRRAARFTVGNYSCEASVTEMLKASNGTASKTESRAHRLTCLCIPWWTRHLQERPTGQEEDITSNLNSSPQNWPLLQTLFSRTVKEWNDLPQRTIDQTSKTSFIQSILT